MSKTDRLAQIKERFSRVVHLEGQTASAWVDDICWLIAKIERLEAALQAPQDECGNAKVGYTCNCAICRLSVKVERLEAAQQIMANVEIDHCETIERLQAEVDYLKRLENEGAEAVGMERAAKMLMKSALACAERSKSKDEWNRAAVELTANAAAIRAEIKEVQK